MKIGSLCTGYGGLDLAVEEHFGAETVWCAEFDKYASQVIEQRFGIPNYGDISKIDWESLEPVDIITAGYPCQPFSHAGSRKGTNDSRHIWPHIAKAISILRPSYVVLENVRGHLSLGLKEVLQELASLGYDAEWRAVRASDTGAPHRRERVFIVAQPSNSDSKRFSLGHNQSREVGNQGQSQPQPSELVSQTTIYASNQHQSPNKSLQGLGRKLTSRRDMHLQRTPNALDETDKLNADFVEYMMGLPEGWVTQSGLSRAQTLKMLGNGVVPQQAKLALELMV
jgi:DNA (cytosine-5)-methyltransferase 1